MKKVLFVASECVPFIKTGGLADVVGSLPKYFDKSKYDVRVMIPKYTAIPEEYKNQMHYITHFYLELAGGEEEEIETSHIANVTNFRIILV